MPEQHQRYLMDTYQGQVITTVHRHGWTDGREWVALAENIFHPQGGGQPSDVGTVAGIPAKPLNLEELPGWVLLGAADPAGEASLLPDAGTSVEAAIDMDRRTLHAALHTAGHLVDAAVRRCGFTHIVSNHFPGQARIEFHADGGEIDRDGFATKIQEEVAAVIADDIEVTTDHDAEGRRLVVIGDYSVDRCGGTHVHRLSQLDELAIRSIKVKKGRLKVGYSAVHRDTVDGS